MQKRTLLFTAVILLLSRHCIYSQSAEAEEAVITEAEATELLQNEAFGESLDSAETKETEAFPSDITELLDKIQADLAKDATKLTADNSTEALADTVLEAQTTDEASTEETEATADQTATVEYKTLSLPLIEREEIERFRKQYLDPKWTKVLRDSLEQAIDYRLYVRKALEEADLPPELEYLPVVESSYKTTAKSSSGALGLWQFMSNSVKPFLVLNDYVDERLDPWKETDAALRKLKENYDMFGDWLIAIAAYNCGAGAMTRALNKAEVKDFWYLCDHNLIPAQTKLYVPKLLAIADLAINCQYYKLDIPLHEEEYEVLYNERNAIFDYVTVSKAYSISQLAQNMRIATSELKRLNPSFTLGFTHPSLQSSIRLPEGTAQIATEALSKMEPIDFPIKYTVVKGDSLWSISRAYKVTVSQICELNGIKENDILKIGKILYIPSK